MGSASASFFASELRRARDALGMSQAQLAQTISYSPSLVAMVESGKRTPSQDFASRADDCLDTGGLLSRILDQLLAKEITPEWFRPWTELEREATSLRSYHPGLIEGLLQTPDYVRAVLSADASLSDDEIEQGTAARLERQAILAGDKPPMFIAVVDEAVLRRPVGGPKVMHAQCLHLIETSERPRTLIQMLPQATGMHPGLDGPFVIATFDSAGEAVYLDGQRGYVVDHPAVVSKVRQTWESLRAEALPPRQSVDLIREVAQTWT